GYAGGYLLFGMSLLLWAIAFIAIESHTEILLTVTAQ
ncbi:putative membrane protein, partial [Yersinia pestis PY-03]